MTMIIIVLKIMVKGTYNGSVSPSGRSSASRGSSGRGSAVCNAKNVTITITTITIIITAI